MTDYQTDDMLKGRIVANRQMIAHCENEIKQLEGVMKGRSYRPKVEGTVTEIPEGFILHDGGPIMNHTKIEDVIWRNGETHKGCFGVFFWKGDKPYLGNNQDVIAYRLKPAVRESSVGKVIESLAEHLSGNGIQSISASELLNQFAAAIIKEARG